MPTAEISDEAHQTAKSKDGTIADVVDGWLEQTGTLDAMFIVDESDDILHQPTVSPHGHLEAECRAPNDGVWIAVGPAQAQALMSKTDGKQCEVCYDE